MISTISSVHSFADTLALELMNHAQKDVWGLSKIQMILPTRRAAKTMREAFLRQSRGQTMMLPKMTALYDLETTDTHIPDGISAVERQFLLMRLCQQRQSLSPDKAFQLAGSLASLLDEMHQHEVSLDCLETLVPDIFAEHWQQTLQFLDIIKTFWPQILAQRNQIDPADRQIRVIDALISSWQTSPPQESVYAIGFTGGLPAIERFLKAVHALPNGHVILPDLDTRMNDEDWDALDETHPQYHLKKLLTALDIDRRNVRVIHEKADERQRFICESLKPAATTNDWRDVQPFDTSVLQNVRSIACATPVSEALTIACELRRVLETPGKTAALVTTDRTLSRRVISEMKRWDVLLDDSAGTPLTKTPVGSYLLLLANAALEKSGNALLALLKHPLATDGDAVGVLKLKVRDWEKTARLQKTPFSPELKTRLEPFFTLFTGSEPVPADELLKAHLKVAEDLAQTNDRSGKERLWAKEEGEQAAALLTEIQEELTNLAPIWPHHYPAFLNALFMGVNVRPLYGMHPRLDILGPIEARLQHPDVVIIGGMNEGTWPQTVEADPWFSRPMRAMCGLPLPEEKIGVMTHDFAHLMMTKEVILTRSLKQDGTPSIPSRWISRMHALMAINGIKGPVEQENIVTVLQSVNAVETPVRPAPTPPVEARPKRLSVTRIEEWMKDPYSIYARSILGLKKLDELDEELSIKDYGIATHRALEEFLKISPPCLDISVLLNLGNKAFEEAGFTPGLLAFWKPKFERLAAWFIDRQKERLSRNPHFYLEEKGSLSIALDNGKTFELTGKADRIDVFEDNHAEVIDYKTGTPPKPKEVAAGEAPQLLLEGALLKNNGFKYIPDSDKMVIEDMTYWRLTGTQKGGEIKSVSNSKTKQSPDEMIEQAMQGLKNLINCFENPETPYVSCPKPKRPAYNDYEHLARLPEWMNADEED